MRQSVTPAARPYGYRPDIDGLRALAVLPVILFHANIFRFSGGFVGVDVFFVISGFLITGVILNDLNSGKFSVGQFYERRVRRIFPALFLMLSITTMLAVAILPPSVLLHSGEALAASAGFSSNLLFWRQDSYFNDTMWRNPILHTWSLSVEEQFYIVYPLLLYLLRGRSRQHLRAVIGLLLVLSFAFAVWATEHAPTMAFYLMPSRAWELMLGALAAVEGLPRLRSRPIREGAALLGIALIGWSVVTYTQSTRFPGLAALAPCVGAVLLIQSGMNGGAFINRAISWRPVVFVGLISYPLYLWHWPILVFAREQLGLHLRHREIALCVAAAFLLATASWLLLERPIRQRAVLRTRRSLFLAAAACLLATAGGGLAITAARGLLWRYPPQARAILAEGNDGGGAYFRTASCFVTPEEARFDPTTCLRVDDTKPNVLLLGDSHAAQLWYGLHAAYPEANILQATASGCRPVIGGSVQGKDICHPLIYGVLRDFLPKHQIDAVIIAGGWVNDETDLRYLPETIQYVHRHSRRVIVVGPINGYDLPLPELLANEVRTTLPEAGRHRLKNIARLDAQMSDLSRRSGAEYLSLYQLLCAQTPCTTYAAPGVPMQFDAFHLTPAGSIYVARRWRTDGALSFGPATPVSSQRNE